jgi:ferredoxin-nitrite reductase
MSQSGGLTEEQKNFLQGFAMGSDVARAVRGLPIVSGAGSAAGVSGAALRIGPGGTVVSPIGAPDGATGSGAALAGPEHAMLEAQDRVLAEGKSLSREEQAKRAKDPLALYDEIQANARAGVFPKGSDVFLYKYSGLFHVAPAQNSFMCRLRLPGGLLRSWQLRGIAEIAGRLGGGYADVTTRANLQIREIGPEDAPAVVERLADLGIITRGSGADNIRNITASPTAGIDPQELMDTLPLARAMHHYILNHREMYGLPRKFNIAFDGGGRVSSLDDTNDIGFRAVFVAERGADAATPAGVYLRLSLGGITGHLDFARDTGVLVQPDECVDVAAAVVRAFIRLGDRTDRKTARLKYVLDRLGFDTFLAEVETELGRPLRRVAADRCEPAGRDDRWGHVGFHRQRQAGKSYVGVVLPVGRLTVEQMDRLASIAEKYGSGTIRLTVWQNLLISDIDEGDIDAVKRALETIGLDWAASSPRAGLVACTGSAGCKYGGADTKANALALAAHLETRLSLDQPINIHLTGCHHSCAQHYIGDIGLEATKVEVGEEMVDGYHLCVGGGWGADRGIARRVADALPFAEIPAAVERLLRHYLAHRGGAEESFAAFARRQAVETLRAVALATPLPLRVLERGLDRDRDRDQVTRSLQTA